MKKLVLALALAGLAVNVQAKALQSSEINSTFSDPKWMKSETQNWMGASNTWYKINTKDASIWMSKDGKKWDKAKDGMWQDKEGKWLKIVDKDLKWSADGGKTWASVPEWKWEGGDGKWYKFDKDWTLWSA